MNASSRSAYEFGGFRIDPGRRVLFGPDGEPIFIKAKAFETLLYLVEHAGDLCEKHDLMAAVWPGLVVEENNLNQCISALRRALGERPGEHKFIVTEPGRGYRFVTPVSNVPSSSSPPSRVLAASMPATDDGRPPGASAAMGAEPPSYRTPITAAAEESTVGVDRDATPSAEAARARTFGRRWDFVVIVALIAALGYFVWDRYSTQLTQATLVTLAVLPFEDLSPNKDEDYFADGIAEEILNSLASVKDLRVTAHTSSFHFKNANEDARTIGKALGVEYLLEGSVRKEGDQVRIAAQLVSTETGYHLWSGRYERKLMDVFAMQDEIAMAVANALEVTLGVGAIAAVPGMTRNVEAYDQYLKAISSDAFSQRIENLQRAVTLDPNFAMAWFWLGDMYRFSIRRASAQDSEVWHRKSIEAYERAREIAPENPYVLINDADMKARDGKYREAGELYEKYLPIAAKYGLKNRIREGGGLFLFRVGKAREAVDALERARSADPFEPTIALDLAEAYSHAGEFKKSFAEVERGLTLTGSNEGQFSGVAIIVALGTGDRDEIRKRLTAADEIRKRLAAAASSADDRTQRAFDFFIDMGRFLDDPGGAKAEIRRLANDESLTSAPIGYGLLAAWAAYYGEPEVALELQKKFVVSRSDTVRAAFSLWEPVFREMRALPGFKDLVRQMGLEEYWRAYGWPDFCRPVAEDDFVCT